MTSSCNLSLCSKRTCGTAGAKTAAPCCRKPVCIGFVILFCLRTLLRIASACTRLAYAKTHCQTLASASLTRTESSIMLLKSCFRLASTSAYLELSSATTSATFRYAGFSLRKRNSRTSPLCNFIEVFDVSGA